MSETGILSLSLTFIAVIFIPILTIMIRSIIKWTRMEDTLNHTLKRLDELVKDKDDVHREILAQMTEDRKATNARLRWLEETYWKGKNNAL